MYYEAIDKWNSPPDSYLEHHGVKGMKWGVRKAINKFFGQRKRKKYLKQLRNDTFNKGNDYANKFDKSEKGKALLAAYQKEIRKMENSNSDNYNYDPFYKAEEKYLRASARYEAQNILKDYGNQKFKDFLEADNIRIGKDLVKSYEDSMWKRHTY